MVYLSMSKDELLRAEQYNSNNGNVSDATLDRAVQEVCARHYTASPLLDYLSSDVFRSWASRTMRGNGGDDSDAARERQIQDMRRLVESARETLMQETSRSGQPGGQEITAQPGFVVLTECSDDDEDNVPGRLGRRRDSADHAWRWSPTVQRNRPRRRPSIYEGSTQQRIRMPWEVVRYGDDEDDEDEDEDEDGDEGEDEGENEGEDDDEDDYTDLYELELGNSTVPSPDSLPNNGRENSSPVRPRSNHSRHGRDRANSRGGGHGTAGVTSTIDSFSRTPLQGHGSTLSTRPSSSGSALLPQADFYIEAGKNKCTISFNPPVTARYILLKMWNPSMDIQNSSNIDIQGVVAKGFAGPRYFPALELR